MAETDAVASNAVPTESVAVKMIFYSTHMVYLLGTFTASFPTV